MRKVERRTWKVQIIPTSTFEPSDERRTLFDKYWTEAQTRQRSSSENFDKSILTYSSGGLALSLAFLKDFVPIKYAVCPLLLYFSWICFVLATGITIVSFLVSYKASELSVGYAEKYFLEGNEAFHNKKTWHDVFIRWSNIIAGGAFVVALIATSVFVKINLNREADMAEKRNITTDGMPKALMQKLNSNEPLQKGMPPASMPLAPASPKPGTVPSSQSSGGANGNQKS